MNSQLRAQSFSRYNEVNFQLMVFMKLVYNTVAAKLTDGDFL